MADRSSELRAILAGVRARWSRRAFLRAWMLGAVTAGGDADGRPARGLAARAGRHPARHRRRHRRPRRRRRAVVRVPAAAAAAPIARSRGSSKSRPAVSTKWSSPPSTRATRRRRRSSTMLVADAIRAARGVDPHRIVTADSMRSAAIGGALGSVAFAAAFWFFAPSAGARDRCRRLVPVSRTTTRFEVTPGSIKVREGQPVTVTARIPGIDGGLVPSITVGQGEAARSARMIAGRDASDEFTITLNNITASFPYLVTAGSARSKRIQRRSDSAGARLADRREVRLRRRPRAGVAHRRRRRRHLRAGRHQGAAHDHHRQAGGARAAAAGRWQRGHACRDTTRC